MRRGLAFQTATFVFLIVAAVTAGLFLHGQANRIGRLARDGAEAHAGLCALKADLVRRIGASEMFLHDHPNGIPGISAVTIAASIANQQATLKALKPIICP